MAKTKAPSTPAPEQEIAPPDLSALRKEITSNIITIVKGQETINGAGFKVVLALREAREEYGDNLDRDTVKLTIQESLADAFGLKLEHVQNAPNKNAKDVENFSKRNHAYTLASQLLSMAWPKGESEEKKVAKAIEGGETRFVVIRKLASKSHQNARTGGNAITKENFAAKLKAFLSKAAQDMKESLDEVLDLAEVEAIPAIRAEADADAGDKAEK